MLKSFLLFFSSFCLFGFWGLQSQRPETPVLPEREPSFSEILTDTARAYGVPRELAFSLMAQESEATRAPTFALRYEPGQLSKGRAAALKLGLKGSIDFDEQARGFSSSFCPLQVMGYHAADNGEHWSVLLNPRTCAEYGMRYLAKCRERHAKRSPLDREFKALECYNGGEKYARDVLNRLGQRLLGEYLARGLPARTTGEDLRTRTESNL